MEVLVVMPDHVHVLAQPLCVGGTGCQCVGKDGKANLGSKRQPPPSSAQQYYCLSEILHSIKSYTANQINRFRNTRGTLWLDEHFDRIVRDEDELKEKMQYIAGNPVKAGLCEHDGDYPYLWCRKSGKM